MPQIGIPFDIWNRADADLRDQFLLAAGFDPNLPIHDAGTNGQMVRLAQDAPGSIASPAAVVHPAAGVPPPAASASPQAGDDLRDFQAVSLLTGDNPVTDEMGIAAPLAGAGLAVAGRALRLVLGGGGGRLTAAIWNSLPSLVRTALTQVGIGVGALIAFNGDIPFITLPGQGGDALPVPFIGPMPPPDIQVGGLPSPMVGVQVVGSWNTNPGNPALGVTFYRLSDGKLAVQNKKGRWKVWRPKRPIVLYAGGASNLKTMLRADKALNKQAKQIASMLNRRAPRKAKAAPKTGIIIESGPGNVINRQ